MTNLVSTTNNVDPDIRLDSLIDRLERLEARLAPMLAQLEQAQPMAGMLGDMFDEYASKARETGIAWEESGKNLLNATLRLGQNFGPEETDDVLRLLRLISKNPNLLPFLEKLVAVGIPAPGENPASQAPTNVGFFGLLRALKEPSIQRTVNWLLAAARRFNGGN